jgi:hypothetical protein
MVVTKVSWMVEMTAVLKAEMRVVLKVGIMAALTVALSNERKNGFRDHINGHHDIASVMIMIR